PLRLAAARLAPAERVAEVDDRDRDPRDHGDPALVVAGRDRRRADAAADRPKRERRDRAVPFRGAAHDRALHLALDVEVVALTDRVLDPREEVLDDLRLVLRPELAPRLDRRLDVAPLDTLRHDSKIDRRAAAVTYAAASARRRGRTRSTVRVRRPRSAASRPRSSSRRPRACARERGTPSARTACP